MFYPCPKRFDWLKVLVVDILLSNQNAGKRKGKEKKEVMMFDAILKIGDKCRMAEPRQKVSYLPTVRATSISRGITNKNAYIAYFKMDYFS